MKKMFGGKMESEQAAREFIRKKKWGKAISLYEKELRDRERDYALWNRLGDLYMQNKARAQAVEAWRRAIDGFASEGLHENVLGIARKMIRLASDEDDAQLLLAEAYLGLEYHADCLAALRSYLKLTKHPSEQDLRNFFKKLLGSSIRHRHLLEELGSIYADSGIDDFELQQRLEEHIKAADQAMAERAPRSTTATEESEPDTPEAGEIKGTSGGDGLIVLKGVNSFPEADDSDFGAYQQVATSDPLWMQRPEKKTEESNGTPSHIELPTGEGKDHYDLGMVYKEMKLWDAAVAEFELARKDPQIRVRATLTLAECLIELQDLRGALALLEQEQSDEAGTPDDKLALSFQIGNIHELLGNVDEALAHFKSVSEQNPSYGDVETRIAELSSNRESSD